MAAVPLQWAGGWWALGKGREEQPNIRLFKLYGPAAPVPSLAGLAGGRVQK